LQKSAYQTTFEKENTYWWHTARRNISLYLRDRLSQIKQPVALNIGCGTGSFSSTLSDKTRIISIDLEMDALRFCQQRGLRNLICGNGEKLPIESDSCDEIYALDILEHLSHESKGASEIYRCLKPQTGFALITVPAFSFLWSQMDDITHHYRRYKKKEFYRLLRETGFSIEKITYYNFFLFPIALIFKLLERKGKKSEEESLIPTIPKWLNFIFKKIFSSEKIFIPRFAFPFGVSIIAIVRKKS